MLGKILYKAKIVSFQLTRNEQIQFVSPLQLDKRLPNLQKQPPFQAYGSAVKEIKRLL